MAVPAEQVISFKGRKFKIHNVGYTGVAATFSVDQSATGVALVEPVSGGPTLTLGSASSGLKTVTAAAGGVGLNSSITVIVVHGASISTSKP